MCSHYLYVRPIMWKIALSVILGAAPFYLLGILQSIKYEHPWFWYFLTMSIFGFIAGFVSAKSVLPGWLISSIVCVITYHFSTPSDAQKPKIDIVRKYQNQGCSYFI